MNRGAVLAALVRVCDAYQDGDVELARRIVEQLRRELEHGGTRYRCGHCGGRFRWPGELADHLAVTSCGRLEERSAA